MTRLEIAQALIDYYEIELDEPLTEENLDEVINHDYDFISWSYIRWHWFLSLQEVMRALSPLCED